MRPLKPLFGLLLLGMAASAIAESPFVFGPQEVAPKSVKPNAKWKEGNIGLPAWPNDNDLIKVSLDSPDTRFSYYIDKNSLSTGGDGVVRYTLVAETNNGTRNVSFEGIRCTPRGVYRVYAYGQARRFQLAVGGDDWRAIDVSGADPIRDELWRHYLCVPRLFEPRAKREQIRVLRSGRVPSVENSGFLTN